MKSTPYKVIMILLLLCLLSVFTLQAYWLRTFFLQKKEQFGLNVYASLQDVISGLHEKEQMSHLKETTVIIDSGDTVRMEQDRPKFKIARAAPRKVKSNKLRKRIPKTQNHDSVILFRHPWTGEALKIEIDGDKTSSSGFPRYDNNDPWSFNPSVKAMATDSVKSEKSVIILKTESESKSDIAVQFTEIDRTEVKTRERKEMEKLVKKMLTEIKVMSGYERNADTIIAQIRRALNSRGIFGDFEFSLVKKEKNRNSVILQSSGFEKDDFYYVGDLSTKKIISSNEFLYLQFPEETDIVMGHMKSSLTLSGIFSLLLLGAFFHTLRLIFAQKKISDMKNDFVNNMTHELKTPIATISLAMDALNNPAVRHNDEKFREYSRILKEENARLNLHVERVLQMSLLDKGKLELDLKPLDIQKLIRETFESYHLRLSERNARVDLQTEHIPCIVHGDEIHLRAVFSNLLDNALKYSGEQPEIGVRLSRMNGEVLATIKDNGKGIEPGQQDKIFEKFYRVQEGDLHDVKGFGLGLSYVKSIIEAHGGEVTVNSHPGKGSEFTIKLKAYAQDPAG